MGKKSQRKQSESEKKRKHSSDNTNSNIDVLKTPRNGGSPKNAQTVSESLHNANSILYNDCTDLNGSVFDSEDRQEANVSLRDKGKQTTDNMAESERGGVQCGVKSCQTKHEDIMCYLKQLDAKISRVDKRLDTLDSLELKMSKFEKDINKLWTFVSDQLKSVNEKVAESAIRVDNLEFSIGVAADDIHRLQKESGRMKDDLLYVQSQSMRNNLVFGNITEDNNETNEQTERKLRQFLEEKLQMAQGIVDGIRFERVHRMGQRATSARNNVRKIVAKFTLFKDRENVRRQRKHLEGTNFFMHEQFPREIVERRNALLPRLKDAKREGKSAWLSYDTLYIDGVPVSNNRA